MGANDTHCVFEFVTTGIGCGGGGLIQERGLQRTPFGYPPKRGLTKVYSLRFEGSNNNITKVKPLLSPSFLFRSSFLPSSSSLFFLQSVVLPLYILFSVTFASGACEFRYGRRTSKFNRIEAPLHLLP